MWQHILAGEGAAQNIDLYDIEKRLRVEVEKAGVGFSLAGRSIDRVIEKNATWPSTAIAISTKDCT